MSQHKRELSLFEAIGGRETLERVHRVFYDELYAHPWLGQFFRHVDQALIEGQQTDFMASAMGGPKDYCGALPQAAHQHMYITEELFELRHAILARSLTRCGVAEALCVRWLKIDGAFRGSLTKRSVAECKGRFATDPIVEVPRP